LYPALGTALEPLSASPAETWREEEERKDESMTKIKLALQEQSRNHPNKKGKR
jgi:hypothetical protein